MGARAARRAGASGVRLTSGGEAGQGLIGAPRNRALSALLEQVVGSSPSTECPTLGTTTSFEPGICAATSRAFAVGVRRSSAPLRISVGTLGKDPFWSAGAVVEYGQKAHPGMSERSSALASV